MSVAYIQMHFRLVFIMEVKLMSPGYNLHNVHIVCNIGCQTTSSDEQADNNCHE